MREEIINGATYRIGRLNARQQWNVVRRLGSLFAAAKPAASLWLENADQEADDTKPLDKAKIIDGVFDAVGPLAAALGELSDETSDYVLNTCLSAVQVNRMGSTWAPVVSRQGQLMFDDLDLATTLRLVMLVLQENLTSFLSAMSGSSPVAQ
jgi:hypothetical protein